MNDLKRMTSKTIDRQMRGNSKPSGRYVRNAVQVRAENKRRYEAAMKKLGAQA